MTPQHVISQLLSSDAKNLKNIDLLKKIILTASLGRLQINGLSPDNKIALANYLFDNERVLFDFTRLSDAKKELFKTWLLEAHQAEKEKQYYSESSVNEYRGFTAEVRLSWWGRIKRWATRDYTEHWKIRDVDLSLNYQLLGLELCYGQQGILVGFNQLLVPFSGTKYKAEDDPQAEPLGNTKRLFITDNLVDQLTKSKLNTLNFESICKNPHPLAIEVTNPEHRYQEMRDYRNVQNYITPKPWYVKLWDWVLSWFKTEPLKQNPPKKPVNQKTNTKLKQLYIDDTTIIYQKGNQEILVKEIRPAIENLVYCGGGSKIFAHIGVWKTLNDMQLVPKKFAGSSAGAIMGLMCYLGFKAEKIAELFRDFKHEHFVYFDLNTRGMSEPDALKTALDYAIALKVDELVTRYQIPYPQGPITFATLEALRVKCPGCGLGEELIVTATNKRSRTTRYFSLHKSPAMEVSEAVKISASLPIVFRDTRLDGEDYNDGGVLNNFPTDAFHADDTCFLESEFGNNMKTLAVQFDNGTERATIDRIKEPVHREHFLINWIYGMMFGVNDPISGWEQDRLKLRNYAAQSIIVTVDNISATDFSVDESTQALLIENGENDAKLYLHQRYSKNEDASYKNKEMMHSTFASIEELLAYCCYKGKKEWFDKVCTIIEKSPLANKTTLLEQSVKLKALYFNHPTQEHDQAISLHAPTFFGNHVTHQFFSEHNNTNHKVLLALYPVFLQLKTKLLGNVNESDLLARARHSFTKNTLFTCLKYFNLIKGETHIVFHIFINLVNELKNELNKPRHKEPGVIPQADKFFCEAKIQEIYEGMGLIEKILSSKTDIFNSKYFFGLWNVTIKQGMKILKRIDSIDSHYSVVTNLCETLKKNEKPTQAVDMNDALNIEDELMADLSLGF